MIFMESGPAIWHPNASYHVYEYVGYQYHSTTAGVLLAINTKPPGKK